MRIWIAIVLSLFLYKAKAQELKNNLYYYHGEQVPLDINYNAFVVTSDTPVWLNPIFGQYGYTIDSLRGGVDHDEHDSVQYWRMIKINNATLTLAQYNTLRSNLKSTHGLGVHPATGHDDPQPISSYFYVQLQNEEDTTTLDSIAQVTNTIRLHPVQYMPKWYALKTTPNSIGNTLEVANYFYETGLFSIGEPGFVFTPQLHGSCSTTTTQTEYTNQWGLEAIDALCAWEYMQINGGFPKGNPNVKVAVIDDGIALNHSDLTNLSPSYWYWDATANPPTGNTASTASQPWPAGTTAAGFGPGGDHGTRVAGIIAAKEDNQKTIGVAPNSTLMSVVYKISNPPSNGAEHLAVGFGWAVANGASVINCSWGTPTTGADYPIFSQKQNGMGIIEGAINNAIKTGRGGKGAIVVFSTGNSGANVTDWPVQYPASAISEIIAVGNVEQKTAGSFTDLQRNVTSCYGTALDLVAPGTDVMTTYPDHMDGKTQKHTGTSFAAPHVAGVAALALSINDCLTEEDLRTMIELSATKVNSKGQGGLYNYKPTVDRPNGDWDEEMGYGLLNAKGVVKYAVASKAASNVDLYIRDTRDDFGKEYNDISANTWTSEDIWVRINDDNGLEHQNPTYTGQPINIYVRVRNRGCSTYVSTGSIWLSLQAQVANTTGGLAWNVVGTKPVSSTIGSGGSTILKFQWTPPSPSSLPFTSFLSLAEMHVCFRAELGLPSQGGAQTFDQYVRQNNDVATKNVSIYLPLSTNTGGVVIAVGAAFDDINGTNADLLFDVPAEEWNTPLTAEAEVHAILHPDLWTKWQNSGGLGSGFTIADETAHDLLITSPHAKLENLHFNAGERSAVALRVNFLTEAVTDKMLFNYDIIQVDSADSTIIHGGERFIVNKPERQDLFLASGNYNSNNQQSVALIAEDINESASYKWYTADTTLVDTGMNVTVAPAVNTKYLLEVTANDDGFKDYAEVTVPVQQPPHNYIVTLNPNPASGQVTVTYNIDSTVQAAEVKITSATNPNIQSSYTLNTAQTQATVPLGTLTPGVYIITLFCDAVSTDSEQLQVQ